MLALEQGPLASKNGSQGLAVVQVAGAPLLVGTEHEHDVPELLRKALEPRSARSDRQRQVSRLMSEHCGSPAQEQGAGPALKLLQG